MIKKIFTIYDEKSEAYLQPFFLDTIGQAKRACTDCCNDVNHQFCKHPADYSLFQLGEFDDSTAEFKIQKKYLVNLIELKTQEEIPTHQLSITEGEIKK